MIAVVRQIRRCFRPVRKYAWLAWRNHIVPPIVRWNYRRVLRRIRASKGKVRVIFPIHELAKWKMQGVFDEMLESDVFDPMMALSGADTDWASPREVVRRRHRALRDYFEKRNMPWVETYDIDGNRCRSLKELKPDIVFYSQPWGHDIRQFVPVVSRYALTCYVPYFVPNYSSLYMEISFLFHCMLFRYFVMNRLMAEAYDKAIPKRCRAGVYAPCGHPALDYFAGRDSGDTETGYVIYAPHWSVDHPNNPNDENYSTFLINGRFILDFAKSHPEYKWVFKPHPTLRDTLVNRHIWEKAEVDAYYAEWERIGVTCYTSEYQDLFLRARLMITDCGSFLVEFAATGHPLIRLVSSTAKLGVKDFNRRLFDSFYNVHDAEELKNVLNQVLVKGDDVKQDERLAAAKEVGLTDSHAAKAIVNHLRRLIGK